MHSLKDIKHKINCVLNAIPDDELDKAYYAARVKKYSSACGCGTGSVFLFVSLAAFIFFVFTGQILKYAHPLTVITMGLLFVFLSAALGKLLGIGTARIRLLILYYSLSKKANASCQPVQNG